MQTRLNQILIGMASLMVMLDLILLAFGHFRIDAHPYLILALCTMLCAGGAIYYGRLRPEPGFSAMFSAAGFLMVFPAACCLLTYLVVASAGTRIDLLLAAFDRSLGVNWLAIMAFAAAHPLFTGILSLAYISIVGQSLLLLLVLGCIKQELNLYGFCVAIGLGAIVTIAVWTAFPAFGAYSVYHLPDATAIKLNLVEGTDYGRQLTLLLKNGPGMISPRDLRGIIGFPSYHTVQAIVLAWYARQIPYVRWIFIVLNVLVVAATPIHGGHHIADILAGIIVAGAAITASETLVRKMQTDARASSPLASAAGRTVGGAEPAR